jgi:rhamnulokinase
MVDGLLLTDEVARFGNAIVERDGRFYWDIHQLLAHITAALGKLASQGVKVRSIGVDTWGVDFGLLDAEGHLLSAPRAYRDPYTDGAPASYFTHIARSEVYARTGIQVMNFNTLFQLYAMSQESPDLLRAARSLLFMPDLISWYLTGKRVCEYTILSTSQFLNPYTKRIDADLLKPCGVSPELFAEVVMPGTVVGLLRDEVLPHPFGYDIPVIAVAGHDTGSAVAAVPADDEEFAYLSSGTWSLMGIEVREPIISAETAALNFTNEGGVEGTTRFLKNITGMWILEQCRKEWERQGKDYPYAQIVRMIDEAPAFARFINPDDPCFANPKSMLASIDAYCTQHGMTPPATDAEVVRLIMESLPLRYREVFGKLREFAPHAVKRLHVIGGGSRNALLNQFTANALGIPVVAGPAEATAIGNVMMQLKALGDVDSIRSMREAIRRAVETTTFLPTDTRAWDEAYHRYLHHTQQQLQS